MTTRPEAPRVVFVDVLRLLAAAQMIQGHTLDALLAPPYRAGAAFEIWTFARGLTSTTFLVTAGLAFALASRSPSQLARGRARRVRRALELMVIGYVMHAPFAVLFGTNVGVAVREALSVDVLQCIGVSLLALEGLSRALGKRAVRAGAAAVLGALCFGLAVPAWGLVPSGWSFGFTSYLTPRGGSLFPLLPWMGYVLFGLAAGMFAFGERPGSTGARLTALGVLALLVAWGFAIAFPGADPRVAPGLLALRLGIVLSLSGALAWGLSRVTRLPHLLSALSAETLFLYVSHVLVLYAAHVGLRARWGNTQTPGEALLVAFALLVVCSGSALGYRRVQRALRRRDPRGTPAAESVSPPTPG